MTKQAILQSFVRCAEHLRKAYKPLKEAAIQMDVADEYLCPDLRVAPIRDMGDTLRKLLGVLDVEIGWIEGEIAKRQRELG
ncbi:unnamed protein product [marine sediment metagenome]|uniref:Uncharacterized protein n=1 Tax=marine sediment metagenome TaxID=412755 RepID=X1R1R0_9ZZZZ